MRSCQRSIGLWGSYAKGAEQVSPRFMRLEVPGEDRDRWRDSRLPGDLVADLIRAAHSVTRPPDQQEKLATVSVYAILLADVRGKPGASIYVGRTGLEPRERFLNHKRGHKASRWVRKYGVGLLPALYEHLNPLHSAESVDIEARLAVALRTTGLHVIQN